MKTLMEEYRENEDNNAHTENYLLLAKHFGTPDQVNEVQKILKGNDKRGYTNLADLQWMHKEINPYFAKLRAERILWNQKFN